MLVLFCVLQVFSGVLWSFLYEYICKYLLFISLYRSEMVLIMRVCLYVYVVYFLFAEVRSSFNVTMSSSVCHLFVFTEVRCSFLCKDVCMCMFFISLCKCEMVLFMWVCLYVYVVYFSLQRWDCPFFVCMYMLFISLYRGERVPFMWLCL